MLKLLDEQVEAPSIHITTGKQSETESPAMCGSPGRPVGTPDNGESVEVQHGLAD